MNLPKLPSFKDVNKVERYVDSVALGACKATIIAGITTMVASKHPTANPKNPIPRIINEPLTPYSLTLWKKRNMAYKKAHTVKVKKKKKFVRPKINNETLNSQGFFSHNIFSTPSKITGKMTATPVK